MGMFLIKKLNNFEKELLEETWKIINRNPTAKITENVMINPPYTIWQIN